MGKSIKEQILCPSSHSSYNQLFSIVVSKTGSSYKLGPVQEKWKKIGKKGKIFSRLCQSAFDFN
jgi:hypothetical protein